MNDNTVTIYERQFVLQSAFLNELKPLAGIIDGIIPHEIQSDALGFLGSLDRPTFPDTVQKARLQFAPNINASKGVDTSIPLRLDPSAMTLVDKEHFRRPGENSLRTIMARATTIPVGDLPGNLLDWSASQTVGDTIFLELVGPNSEFLSNFVNFQSTGAQPTALAYATKPFMHWRGSIDYEVEVFASNGFHQGSLRLGFYPGVYDQAEIPSAVDKSSQYYTLINISEGATKIKLSVPYISQYPWLEINNNSDNSEAAQRFHTTGLFVISVAKQLRTTGQAVDTVAVAVRRAAGPDFKVANMSLHNGSIQLAPTPYEQFPFEVQSGMNTSMSSMPQNSAETVNESQLVGTVGTSTAVLDLDTVTCNFASPTPLSAHKRIQEAVQEQPWTVKDTGNKQTLFASVDWSSTVPNLHVLGVWELPNDALTCELNSIARNRFVNIVADMTIQVEVSSSKFQSGAVALVWLPCVSSRNFTVGAPDNGFLSSQTQIDFTQHLLIHAGRSTSYKMNVQMRHPQSALYLGKGNSMGTLVLITYTKLSTIASVPDVNIMLHATLDNAHVTTPRPCGASGTMYKVKGRSLNTMAQIREIRALEKHVSALGLRSEIRQSGEATIQDTQAQDQSIEVNPSGVSTATLTIGKLPKQTVADNLRVRTVNYAEHFEDVNMNVDQLCKKYTQSNQKYAQIAAGSTVQIRFDIGNDLLFASGAGTAEPFNGAGMIGWYGAMYRAFRGDIRLKFTFRVLPTINEDIPQVFGYVTATFPKLGTSTINTGGAVLAANANLVPPIAAPYITPCNPHQHNFIITPSIPELVEIEIPFNHLGNFQLVPSYSGTINQEPYNFGFIDIELSNASATETIVQIRSMSAFSDAAHFGIPTFIPRLQIITGNYPDFWVGLPEMDEETDIEVVSESEAEVLTPPPRAKTVHATKGIKKMK